MKLEEEVLWRPKRKNQGWDSEGEVKVGDEMRERHSYQTDEARRREGKGKDERMSVLLGGWVPCSALLLWACKALFCFSLVGS